MKKITRKTPGLVIEVTAEYEYTDYVGNCMASGDDAVDREEEESIRTQLANGNEWAWCTARVRVSLGDLFETEYLGCCSYESREDFMHSAYYEDMVEACLCSLTKQAQRAAYMAECEHYWNTVSRT
jgi:hypothetical protein